MVGPSGQVVVPAAGLTVLVNPDHPSLDVVFVHGFKGSPSGTWTKRGIDRSDYDNEPVEPPSKARKLGFLSRPHQGTSPDTSSCFWPQDLLPEILPNARVLTYGYDTKIQHVTDRPVSTTTIYDIAWDFLVALQAESQDEPPRPILFVAHSLGGIVVKEMLRRSSNCLSTQTHLYGIFESTIGIVFLGTPHGGANPHGFLVHIARKFFKAIGYEANESIINALLPNSERLRELTDCFGTMAQERKWIIHSFQEMYRVKYLDQKVVEDGASRLNIPIEVAEHICYDHMGISKFTGINDPEFKKVAAALRRIAHSKSTSSGHSKSHFLSEVMKKDLLDSLGFEQLDARHRSIKSAHAKTCRWILKKSEYRDWLDPRQLDRHHGFLWIKGKPGAGKSTLMKFALANAQRTMKGRIVINFFFNARGDGLEKTTIGMYRSLLLQLLTQLPELQSVFESLGSIVSSRGCPNWDLELLKSLFENAVSHLSISSLICFIDALDECDELQIRDMVSFWGHLGELAVEKKLDFLVCFSSRHYPHITMETGLSLILEGQEGHAQDIVNYVNSELKIGKTKLAEKIRIELQGKATGVFMWVVLVVQILNKEHDSGRIHLLRQRLKDIPSDLHELFREILVRDVRNKDELLLCLQWVMFSRTPLKPEQLYFAIITATVPGDVLKWNRDEISNDDIKRYILHCSKGLAEATQSKEPTIQFIHESVRDFLLKDNGLASLWSNGDEGIEGRSYEQLKQTCLQYFRADVCSEIGLWEDDNLNSSLEASEKRQLATNSLPFLEHAVRNVLYYADKAGGCGVSQEGFLKIFSERSCLQAWIRWNNRFEKFKVRRYTPNAGLLYILAEADAPNLITSHESVTSPFNVEEERYGCALLAAVATRSFRSFQAFRQGLVKSPPSDVATRLQADDDFERQFKTSGINRDFNFSHPEPLLCQISRFNNGALFSSILEAGNFLVDSKGPKGRTALSCAATGSAEVVKVLLATNKVDVNSKDIKGLTPLMWAISAGNKDSVELFLQNDKIEINQIDRHGRTAFSQAAALGHTDIIHLLLETGKTALDLKDNYGRTPLAAAAANGSEEAVRLLIQTGKVDLNSRDNDGHTPLSIAAGEGYNVVIDLLLKTGSVDVNSKGEHDHTPLWRAVVAGNLGAVNQLLQNDEVDVNSKNGTGGTPLSWAAEWNKQGVVRLLLDAEKIDVNSKDNEGLTPLSWAARDGHQAIVELLLQREEIDANSKDIGGRTPLYWAALRGHQGVVELLLQAEKIDVNSEDNAGRTPLGWAKAHGSTKIIKLLLKTGKVSNTEEIFWGTW